MKYPVLGNSSIVHVTTPSTNKQVVAVGMVSIIHQVNTVQSFAMYRLTDVEANGHSCTAAGAFRIQYRFSFVLYDIGVSSYHADKIFLKTEDSSPL
jgi:hypothetical protein